MKNLIFKGDYFKLYEEYLDNRKTPIIHIENLQNIPLGQVKWYGVWRKFCFYPISNTIWDNKCLEQLLNFINDYNSSWRKSK